MNAACNVNAVVAFPCLLRTKAFEVFCVPSKVGNSFLHYTEQKDLFRRSRLETRVWHMVKHCIVIYTD